MIVRRASGSLSGKNAPFPASVIASRHGRADRHHHGDLSQGGADRENRGEGEGSIAGGATFRSRAGSAPASQAKGHDGLNHCGQPDGDHAPGIFRGENRHRNHASDRRAGHRGND